MVLDTDGSDTGRGTSSADTRSADTSTTGPALDGTTTNDPTTTGPAPTFCEITKCDDDDPCTVDACDPDAETCTHDLTPGTPCDDANECTSEDVCQPDGTCSGTGLCTVEHCGEITEDEVWGPDVTHHLTCSINVRGPESPTLTILDGTVVEADPWVSLRVGYGEPGRLDVQGGDLGVVFTSVEDSPLPGDWGGLRFGEQHSGSTVSRATIEYAGGNESAAVRVVGDYWELFHLAISDSIIRESAGHGVEVPQHGRVLIQNTSIVDNQGDGLYMESNTWLAGPFSNNVVTGNGGAAALLNANAVAQLDPSSSYVGNADPVIAFGDVLDSGTWQALDVDYHVIGGGVSFPIDPPTLTIEPGVTMVLSFGAFTVGHWPHVGGLQAFGTADAPIRFVGSQVRLNLASEVESYLEHVIIEDGEGLEVNNPEGPGTGALTITNSIIRNTTGPYALSIEHHAAVTLTNTLIEDNEGIGVDVDGPMVSVTGNTIVNNGAVAMRVAPGTPAAMDASNVITGNALDVVELRDMVLVDAATWPALSVPYRIADDELLYALGPGGNLTVEAGAVIEFGLGASVQVGHTYPHPDPELPDVMLHAGLVLAGEPGNPVILRSSEPSPSPGDWQGLLFTPQSLPSQLDHCVIQHAGGAPYQGAVVVEVDGIGVSNCTIRDSASYGIYQDGATATLSGNTYVNNVDGDVFP